MHSDCQTVLFFVLLTFKILKMERTRPYTTLELSWTHESKQLISPVWIDSWRKHKFHCNSKLSITFFIMFPLPLDIWIRCWNPPAETCITNCKLVAQHIPTSFTAFTLLGHSRSFWSLEYDLSSISMILTPNNSSWEERINRSGNDLQNIKSTLSD